ncbi:MAG TPA: MBL fold metallo-hydrolase [Thermoguttaceae bacterium]|nr:MBL fold metallo-hydrolase [Thermoguttaceae bacterium]
MSPRQLDLLTIVSIPFEENTFVVQISQHDDCVVIDPGLEPEKIIDELENRRLSPAAILITHAHGDHIGGNRALKDRWPDCPLVIGVNEAAKLTNPKANLSSMFGFDLTSPPADVTLAHGQTYSAAGIDFEVREIPGHSSGHIVYLVRRPKPIWVFVGDVIFSGSVGRTDFPDGSFEALADGIHRELFTLPDDTQLFPGHGPATTVGREKRTNPFVGLATDE